MRLNLYRRGIDLLDIELHILRPRDHDDEPAIEASGNLLTERAEPYQPDTEVRIGFQAR